MKPGYQTSEFWITTITSILNGVIAVVFTYGAINEEQAQAWMALAAAIAVVMGTFLAQRYVVSRTMLKMDG